jgi:ribosome-associated protein
MIRIKDNLSISDNEITFAASRSGGPGGQNVNKVSSRMTLSFDVVHSPSLSEEQRKMILRALATRINKDGILRIASQRTRSQDMNRADTIERFIELIQRALTPRRPRIKTRTPGAAKERRLDKKKKRAVTKHARSSKGWDS